MRPRVVICGSYHREPNELTRLFKELEATGCRVLSPISIEFTDDTVPIVRAEYEDNFGIAALEHWHLRALRSADFVMLHAPEGYIGISGAYEIGYANALQKPIFSLHALQDEMLASQVEQASSVFTILERLELSA